MAGGRRGGLAKNEFFTSSGTSFFFSIASLFPDPDFLDDGNCTDVGRELGEEVGVGEGNPAMEARWRMGSGNAAERPERAGFAGWKRGEELEINRGPVDLRAAIGLPFPRSASPASLSSAEPPVFEDLPFAGT